MKMVIARTLRSSNFANFLQHILIIGILPYAWLKRLLMQDLTHIRVQGKSHKAHTVKDSVYLVFGKVFILSHLSKNKSYFS